MEKLVVITGASKGIGAATAEVFAKAGYDVVINYLSDDDAAQRVAAAVEKVDRRATLVKTDVFMSQGVDQLVAQLKTMGKIDVFINNAGLPEEPQFGKWTEDSIVANSMANFGAAALCTQAVEPLMRDGGVLLYTSSTYGLDFGGNPNQPLYSAGKAATLNFMQSMAERLAPRLRCNAVAPGMTDTPGWDGIDDRFVKRNLEMTLLQQWVKAEEIAQAYLFLAETPHCTGQTIVVDSGWQKKIRRHT